jgi:hypothetical protein
MSLRKHVRLTLLVVMAVTAGIAQGSSITFSGLQFTAPVFAFGANDAIVSPTTVSGPYSYSAEFCVQGDCSFSLPGSGNPSSLELSNLTLSCQNEVTCSPLDVTFQAGFDVAPGSNESIQVLLGNTSFSGAFSGLARICFSDSTHICASDLTGTSSFGFSFSSGSFTGGSVGNYQPGASGPFELLGLFHIDGLAPGGTINIGQSLDVVTSDALGGGTGVPEPATLLLFPIGFFVLATLAKVRSLRAK